MLGARKYAEYETRVKVETVRESLRSEIARSIPVGSTPERVWDFLNSKGIEHTGYESAGHDMAVVMGAPAIIEGRVEIKTISLYAYSIHMVFKFDEQKRFLSYADSVEGKFL